MGLDKGFSKETAKHGGKGGHVHKLLDFPGNSVRADLSGLHFMAKRLDIHLGKAGLQVRLAIEENLQVVGVFEVFDQRRVCDHALEKLAQGIMAAFSSLSAPEIAEESLHDVIGSLGLNAPGAVRCFYGDRIGEEFGPILIDLSDQGLPMGRGWVIASRGNPAAELLDCLPDRAHG